MKRSDVDINRVTLLHKTNLKFLQGKMTEPINDIEMVQNIERQWQATQPKWWMIVSIIFLGVFMVGVGIGFWVFIMATFVLDYQSFLNQAPMEMLGVLFINAIILAMTGLCGWGGIYLLEFVVAYLKDKDNHLKPDGIFKKMLLEGDYVTGQALFFLDMERTQVVFHVDGSRYIYTLQERSEFEAGDFVLALCWEQYIVLL